MRAWGSVRIYRKSANGSLVTAIHFGGHLLRSTYSTFLILILRRIHCCVLPTDETKASIMSEVVDTPGSKAEQDLKEKHREAFNLKVLGVDSNGLVPQYWRRCRRLSSTKAKKHATDPVAVERSYQNCERLE